MESAWQDQLASVVALDPPGWWPLAWGYWIVIILVVITMATLATWGYLRRQPHRKAYRRLTRLLAQVDRGEITHTAALRSAMQITRSGMAPSLDAGSLSWPTSAWLDAVYRASGMVVMEPAPLDAVLFGGQDATPESVIEFAELARGWLMSNATPHD